MGKRVTIEEVREYIEEQGCKLIEFINTNIKMKFICNCGNEHSAMWHDFRRGRRCKECGKKKAYKKRAFTIDFIRSEFEKAGCILLSTEYVRARDKLDYICSCGNKSKISYDVFRKGHRCSKCGDEKTAKARRVPYEKIKKMFEEKNCVLLTPEEEYKNGTTPVDYICSCGNISSVLPNAMKNQSGCLKCSPERLKRTCLERYGVENPMQNKNIRKKALKTAYENDTFPTSSQQSYIHSLIKGELNHVVGTSVLDIAYPEENIYVEYDGGFHDGRVKFGKITKEEFDKKEVARRYALYRRGWKEIRIISRKDNLPTPDIIKQMIQFAKEYLSTGHSWIHFDIDKGIVTSSQFEEVFNFGEVKRYRKTV